MTLPEYPHGFAFCESIAATGRSKWHIRPLSQKWKMLGGGADTLSLCGREMAWDLNVPLITEMHVKSICPKCYAEYRRIHDR